MPDKNTVEEAHRLRDQGKSPSTQAGAFVKAEIDKVRSGDHGVRNTKQAIAIGLSEARRAGVALPDPEASSVSKATLEKSKTDRRAGRKQTTGKSRERSKATLKALRREPHSAVSKSALSKQAKSAAKKRTASDRSTAAKRAAKKRKEHA